MREALIRLDLKRMVDCGPRVSPLHGQRRELRVLDPQAALRDSGSAAQRRSCREDIQERIRDRPVRRGALSQILVGQLVEIEAFDLLEGVRSGVSDIDQYPCGELALDIELPLLAVRIHAAVVEKAQAIARLSHQSNAATDRLN